MLEEIALTDLNQANFEQLISAGVQESSRIEYKRITYGGSDADKKEYLKDVSALANTFGGHLLIGIDENHGLPTAIVPVTGNLDAEILRLESLARDGLEPRVNGLQVRAVPVTGGAVIVLRVPRSWSAPHRVSFKGTSRFYSRTSSGVYELSVEELRTKFNLSASALDRARSFRQQRLALLASDDGIAPLNQEGGRLAIHIFPLSASGEPVVNLERALEISDRLAPIGSTGWSSEFNFDGFANTRSSNLGYTQVFRDGSLEAVRIPVISRNGPRRIPALAFADPIIKAVPNYILALQDLGVQPPLAIMITVSGVMGVYLGYSQDQFTDESAIIRRDTLELPIVLVQEYSDQRTYQTALRPAFDALWNAGGLSGCTYYDSRGEWHPPN